MTDSHSAVSALIHEMLANTDGPARMFLDCSVCGGGFDSKEG